MHERKLMKALPENSSSQHQGQPQGKNSAHQINTGTSVDPNSTCWLLTSTYAASFDIKMKMPCADEFRMHCPEEFLRETFPLHSALRGSRKSWRLWVAGHADETSSAWRGRILARGGDRIGVTGLDLSSMKSDSWVKTCGSSVTGRADSLTHKWRG